MNYFSFSTLAIFLLVISTTMVVSGLYWMLTKKYNDDLWVKTTGRNIFLFGIFVLINSIAFSVNLPKIKYKEKCNKDINPTKTCLKNND